MGCGTGSASKIKDLDSLDLIDQEIEDMKSKLTSLKDKYQENADEALIGPLKDDIKKLETDLESKVKEAEQKLGEMKDDDSKKKEREEKLNKLKGTCKEVINTNKEIFEKNFLDEPDE